MSKLIINTILVLGLNKAVLKASLIFSFTATTILNIIDKYIPTYFLGMALMLWVLYVITITLDWLTGLSASRFEARRDNIQFVFDKEKANVSWYKHALFIIIISAIYHFQQEALRKGFSPWIISSLTGLQFIYFAYNIMTEWISIEDNRFRVSGKITRVSKVLNTVLDILDKALYRKLNDVTDQKNCNQ
jgi:hypothetical protein